MNRVTFDNVAATVLSVTCDLGNSESDQRDQRNQRYNELHALTRTSKFRVLVVGRDLLDRAREIVPSSVVKPGVKEEDRAFVEKR